MISKPTDPNDPTLVIRQLRLLAYELERGVIQVKSGQLDIQFKYDETGFLGRTLTSVAVTSDIVFVPKPDKCKHERTVTHYTGDGTPVYFCPECGRSKVLKGGA